MRVIGVKSWPLRLPRASALRLMKPLVTLQPAKTGMEYGRELARRLRDVPVAIEGFGNGLRQYEGVWYGFGAAGDGTYQTLRGTWEEMRRHA